MLKKLLIIFSHFVICYSLQCYLPSDNYRLDCFPEAQANEQNCQSRGCCWSPPSQYKRKKDSTSIPYCYYPTDFPNYEIKSLETTKRGYKAILTKKQQSFLPKEILHLNFELIFETSSRIRIRLTDLDNKRFEVPISLGSPDINPPPFLNYTVIIPSNGTFSFEVKRNSDGISLFKSFGPVLYSDQFIQISSLMSTNHVYGIGERNQPFLYDFEDKWSRNGLWTRDHQIDTYNNLYGVHPFYMGMPKNGKAFGVFHFNSNAQEFVLQPAPIITYRTIGGILDIFIFTGDTPENVVSQYTELIGRPMLPPFWSFGFHLSRFGYKNISHISEVLNRNMNANIPIEVQWSDIDYMDNYKDFTIDPKNYYGMSDFVRSIREKYGVKYVVIIDPGINIKNSYPYPPYDEGIEMNIFIRDSITGKPLVGNSWAGDAFYPDFTHPNITKYWFKQISNFHKSLPIDGLWIDMDEPCSFYDGSKTGCPQNNTYDYPFFVPHIRDNSLILRTLCSSSLHYNDILHYNLHNLYAYTESITTHNALLNTLENKRVFILSRSSFSGAGKYTFHWTGDNTAAWDFLANSIRQVLNFNMFGIPMIGADICGFMGNATEELCVRWTQLGAFYPFMRNHNANDANDQDPAAWSLEGQTIMRESINMRYALLPNFYTLMVKSHLKGGTVFRPLSFEFYSDYATHSIEQQFMIGSSLLVNPVVQQGVKNIDAYFPGGIWYDLNDLQVIHSGNTGQWINLYTPLNKTNVALRGGQIITLFKPQMNIDLMRGHGCFLLCALSMDYSAFGDLYWDDGISFDSYISNRYNYFEYSANTNSLLVNPIYLGYASNPTLLSITILGLNQTSIKNVTVNDEPISFIYKGKVLSADIGNLSMSKVISMKWK